MAGIDAQHGNVRLFKTNSRSVEELAIQLRGASTVDGKPFDPTSTASILALCGNIGAVHEPNYYATWPFARIYLVLSLQGLLGYAVVRFEPRNGPHLATFVIDAFGVSPACRSKGMGTRLFEYIKSDVTSPTSSSTLGSDLEAKGEWYTVLLQHGHLSADEPYTMSIQSIFDYPSYVGALREHTTEIKSPRHVVTIDMTAVLQGLTGSCVFWRRMGFVNERIVCNTSGFSVAEPVVLMWFRVR